MPNIRRDNDIEHQIEAEMMRRRDAARQWLIEQGRPDIAADFDKKLRDVDTDVHGARMCWHSITLAQRAVLAAVANYGGDGVVREDRHYRYRRRNQPSHPIYTRTIGVLCRHGLLAWDGGAFDPEAAAVLTERGRFVLQYGPTAP